MDVSNVTSPKILPAIELYRQTSEKLEIISVSSDGQTVLFLNDLNEVYVANVSNSQARIKLEIDGGGLIMAFCNNRKTGYYIIEDLFYFDAYNQTLLKILSLPEVTGLLDLKISMDCSTVFITVYESDSQILYIIDVTHPESARVLSNFTTKSYIDDYVISSDVKTLFVSTNNSLRILDISELTSPKCYIYTSPTELNFKFTWLQLSPDDNILLFYNKFLDESNYRFGIADVSDLENPIFFLPNILSNPLAYIFSYDSQFLFTNRLQGFSTSMVFVNVKSDQQLFFAPLNMNISPISLDKPGGYINLAPDGQTIVVGYETSLEIFLVFNQTELVSQGTIDTYFPPIQVLFTPDSRTAFVAIDGEILIIDIFNKTRLKSINYQCGDVGDIPFGLLPDGKTLIIWSGDGEHNMSLIAVDVTNVRH